MIILKSSKKGFSLVELLVVLAIIVVLSLVGLLAYSEARISGKDAKRKKDLTEIAQAVELYYQTNRVYPGVAGTWYSSLAAQPWIPGLVPNFIQILPLDPVQNITYRYGYISLPTNSSNPLAIPPCPNLSNGQFYILAALLEAANDKDSIGNKVVKECNGIPISNYPVFNTPPENLYKWYVLTTP